MPIELTPEVGIPLPVKLTRLEKFDIRVRAQAACAAISALVDGGATIEEVDLAGTPADSARAVELFTTDKVLRPSDYAKQAVILKLEGLLTLYEHEVVQDATRLRRYVTNRLIEESDDDSPKIRLRALELIGKINNVGLFSEKSEVIVKHGTTQELENLIREKLGRLIDVQPEATPDDPAVLLKELHSFESQP